MKNLSFHKESKFYQMYKFIFLKIYLNQKKEEEEIKSKIERLNEQIFEFVTEYKKQYEEDQ